MAMEITKLNDLVCVQCGKTYKLPLLSESGPHIKAECPKCMSYIKFVSPKELPDIKQLRLMIWELGMKDTRLIESCKILCGFNLNKSRSANEIYLQYWKLLRWIVTTIENANFKCETLPSVTLE